MGRFSLFFRSLLLQLALILPPTILSALLLAGTATTVRAYGRGALVGFLVGALISALLALKSEDGVIRYYRATPFETPGARTTLERAATASAKLPELPEIYRFNHPLAQAIVARSSASDGAILLSEAALSLLSEEELRSLLALALGRLRRPEMGFQTTCGFLLLWINQVTPRLGRKSMTPFAALRALALFPMARFLTWLGGVGLSSTAVFRLPTGPNPEVSRLAALRKLGASYPHLSSRTPLSL